MSYKSFQEALKSLLQDEGVYSNDPTDKGKETVYGISRVNWPYWAGWVVVDQVKKTTTSLILIVDHLKESPLLQTQVSNFYGDNYWVPLHCDELADPIAAELFNTSVNMGKSYGVKCLQRALNKLNRNQKDFADLKVDGDIGRVTLKAYADYMATSALPSRSEASCTRWLLKWMNYFQMERYNDLTDLHPEQEKFVPGWTDRG